MSCCVSAQAELTGLLLYLVWFGHVVLLLPPAPDGTNLLFGVRRILASSFPQKFPLSHLLNAIIAD